MASSVEQRRGRHRRAEGASVPFARLAVLDDMTDILSCYVCTPASQHLFDEFLFMSRSFETHFSFLSFLFYSVIAFLCKNPTRSRAPQVGGPTWAQYNHKTVAPGFFQEKKPNNRT